MNVIDKIRGLIGLGPQINEDQVRSLMILLRKQLEVADDKERTQYSTVNLFCNWCAHTEITQSLAGLRVLGRINDALVKVKSSHTDEVRKQLSQAVGFDTFRSELILLLEKLGIEHDLSQNNSWGPFLDRIIEIIRDVPLAFPPVGKFNKSTRKIYDQIVQNPIKPGASVILITLSKVNYGLLGAKGLGEMMCLLIRTEDTTTIVVPLEL